ncbi:MAG: MgtC/SapB family protein [Lentisphaeria bacterium]|nr:MgtC/SapB family protein [Lentisphaeria bacterium]NQZ69553.1 MgtC/SapB family protein [Lentisphaeria bacterium]
MLEYFTSSNTIDFMCRILMAAFLGGLIGLERDIHGRAAGMRTYLLVGMGSALFMVLSIIVSIPGPGMMMTDPGRIAAQIVTGIGFLGAGAIMKDGFNVRGLTTASCFWIVAAVGMACGFGRYDLAIGSSVITLIALSLLKHFDKLYRRDSYRTLELKLPLGVNVEEVIELVKCEGVNIQYVDLNQDYENEFVKMVLSLKLYHQGSTDKHSEAIIEALSAADIGLKQLNWTHRSF